MVKKVRCKAEEVILATLKHWSGRAPGADPTLWLVTGAGPGRKRRSRRLSVAHER